MWSGKNVRQSAQFETVRAENTMVADKPYVNICQRQQQIVSIYIFYILYDMEQYVMIFICLVSLT